MSLPICYTYIIIIIVAKMQDDNTVSGYISMSHHIGPDGGVWAVGPFSEVSFM